MLLIVERWISELKVIESKSTFVATLADSDNNPSELGATGKNIYKNLFLKIHFDKP